ncbi:preprotein translocase subunit SecG [Paracoccaceae bacterium]|jgi:preprotein translocase subunit SecG|nr:preprotein translocase subunit SecG [Paracoccaceae bacterium]|tara:strand:- start:751 stop:1125 length:375 start_codon:yes stop_codon:yes gene_type:complete
MENIVLTIHLILALALVGIVLLQRSEGGGLGLGGGGGGGDGIMSGRGAATALTKITWVLAIAFIITSMSLTIIASRNANSSSIFDRLGSERETEEINTDALLPPTDELLPPVKGEGAPLVPSAD